MKIEAIKARFESGNQFPVTKALLPKEEFDWLISEMEQLHSLATTAMEQHEIVGRLYQESIKEIERLHEEIRTEQRLSCREQVGIQQVEIERLTAEVNEQAQLLGGGVEPAKCLHRSCGQAGGRPCRMAGLVRRGQLFWSQRHGRRAERCHPTHQVAGRFDLGDGGGSMKTLWAIHIPGPDEYHAAPSEVMAKEMAAKHNAAVQAYASKNNQDWLGPEMINAKVVEWPWPAEEHAAEIAEFDYADQDTPAKQAQTALRAALAEPAVGPVAKAMTAHRAAYFMERFKKEEKLLGPNEQAAVDFVIDMLTATHTAPPPPAEPAADAAPAAVAGPKKWAPEEVEDGERGIRWVTNEGIHGRPTDHDVREYLKRTPTANGCLCDECKVFYAAAPTTQPAPPQEAAESVPALGREQERIAFKDAHRHLELDEVPDAWGRPMFKHSHVDASWLGWIARASRGQTLRLLTQKEMDSLGHRAEGMDGNQWDQWVQEKFAQVNGLKVQGGSYE